MTEIRVRNRLLRLVVNLALLGAFLILVIWQLSELRSEQREAGLLAEQIPVLEQDVAAKEQRFLTEQTLFEKSRKRLTAREEVEQSLKLQELRQSLEGSRKQLAEKQSCREQLQLQRRIHHFWLIGGAILLVVLLWVNYLLDY